jgi:hypothetical protein
MIAAPSRTEERTATQGATVDELESLVPAAARLAQLHDAGTLSEEAFERGLSNLFRSAREARAALGAEYTKVHLDWSDDPVKIGLSRSSTEYEGLRARIHRLLQPYFGYGWEYCDGTPPGAVRFDERQVLGPDGETDLVVAIHGAWVDLVR